MIKRLGFKRVIRATLLGVLLLLLVVVAATAYITTTNAGLKQLLTLAQRNLPGELAITQIEGSLLDELTLQGVSYRHQKARVTISRLHVAWTPLALFSGMLHVNALQISHPEITLSTAETAPSSPATALFPIRVAAIELPFKLRIDQLQLTRMVLQRPPLEGQVSPPILIDSVRLQLHTQSSSQTQSQAIAQVLVLDQFRIEAPQGRLQLQGQLTPRGTFPLQLTTDWQVNLPGYPALQGQGRIEGNLSELTLEQRLTGLLNAQVSAQLHALLDRPRGEVQVDAFQADLGLLPPQLQALLLRAGSLPGKTLAGESLPGESLPSETLDGELLRGKFNARADLQGGALRGQWQARLPGLGDSELDLQLQLSGDRLQLEQLVFTQLDSTRLASTQQGSGAELQLRGSLEEIWASPQLALSGGWKNLRYPLQGSALLTSSQGQFTLNGSLQQYQLELRTDLAGPEIPAGTWQLQAQGSEQGLSPFTLTGATLEGQLQAQGEIVWLPSLSGQVVLRGQQLNPGVHWPDWPAELDFEASVAGALSGSLDAAQGLSVQADINDISGTLRAEPLQGRAKVRLSGAELWIERLQLAVAGAELEAKGVLGRQVDLDWSLDAPRLQQLLPNAQGSLRGKGALRGPKTQLHLSANVQGRKLGWDQQRIASLDAELDIDLSAQQPSRLQIDAQQLSIDGQQWQQLRLNGQGTPAVHQLQLSLEQGPAELQLALRGSWLEPLWRGSITQLDLSQDLLGRWQLLRPVTVAVSRSSADIEALCLQRLPENKAELCLHGRWSSSDGIQAALQAQELPLQLLEPWLPVGTQIKGQLQAQADFTQHPGEMPRYQASARLLGSELLLEDEDLRVEGGEIHLALQGRDQQLSAQLQLPLLQPTGSVQAELAVADLYTSPELNGELALGLSELKFISLFIPQLQAISGSLASVVSVSGHLDQPRVQGHLQLLNASAEVPALGVKLDAIELDLRDQPDSGALQLTSSLRSGTGKLQLNGQFSPLARSGQLTLTGEHVQAVNTREVKAWISPALEIVIEPELLQLRGEINIPQAKIKPPPLTFNASLSEDVVILDPQSDADNALEAAPQVLDARLRLTLGDRVEVDALGFKGRLEGSVLVEDDGRRATRATGAMQVAAGKYRLYGQDLNIERGSLVFSGGPVDNPGLDLRVSRKVEEVTAGARVSGTLRTPRLKLFSEPAMPESSLLSYLLLGRPPGAESSTPSEQELLLKAALALATMGGNALAENITETLSIDELGFESADADNNTALYIGKYLSSRLYVKYGVGLLQPTNTFFMRYRLNKHWSLESETGTNTSGGDIIYTLER
ncbi:MAG: translocation/assembly module TamB domain-containing protein [Motiliproteus sp.]